jgi:hypothetical protein
MPDIHDPSEDAQAGDRGAASSDGPGSDHTAGAGVEQSSSTETGGALASCPGARPRLRLVGGTEAQATPTSPTPSHPPSPLLRAQSPEDRALLEERAGARELVTYVSGQPGTGKSTLLLHWILADVAAGRGCVVIDPHGDLARDVLERLPGDDATLARVALFDPSDRDWPMGLDLLDADTEEEQDLVVQFVFEMFDELFLAEHQGPVLQQSIGNALRLIMETRGCLAEVPLLFTDDAVAKRRIPMARDPFVKHYFTHVWGKTVGQARSEMLGYFTSKLARFLDDRVLRNILSQPARLDLGAFLDGGGILIADLSRGRVGDLNARMLGMILLHRIARATLLRADRPAGDRTPVQVYVDEFHELTTPQLYRLLPTARKFNVGFTLAHQRLDMLPRAAQEAIVGTAGHLVLFRQGDEVFRLPLDELFWPRFGSSDFMHLPNYRALARVTPRSGEARVGRLQVVPVPAGYAERPSQVRERSRERFGRPRAEVEKAILVRIGWQQEDSPPGEPLSNA